MLGRIRAAVAAGAPLAGGCVPLEGDGPDLAVDGVPRRYRRTGDQPPGSPAVLDVLVDRLEDYRATVHRCAAADVARAVRTALGDARSVVVPPGLPDGTVDTAAPDAPEVVVDGRPEPLSAVALDRIDAVVTAARVACAVTGTIVLDGEPDQGRRVITLIPDRHVVVLRAEQVVQTWPETVALLEPTRPLTMISGPSATSDIELSRVEGVHGPRNLQVVIVDPA
ncbi:hypothetical protein GCM10011594_05170 [Nakamurella endophytica]|uniref:LUD domain-containing protein n=2 Tax=Nakamurella endophytica TaxID=1748367 RepID=A0A917SML6_9ACTN|nr:hypothetical protein GCM10011594_05170 [Nakamurella endophytica]